MPPIDNPHPLHSPSPVTSNAIPKLGQTRCYWALLSAELEYLYVDPVFHSHLGPQAENIIGRKLLEFVHPDEHASAQQDLGKVLESRTLHGSVTRVRYSRLHRTRARLGFTGVHDIFADEDKVSFDEDYIACDLVINWAAEGLVLCFIHAVVDMSPQDNDEHHRTHWTNWCGTPRMTAEHGSELYHALFHIAPHAAQGAPPPTRVFQILHNSTDRPTLFSWPAEGYIPADYGRLANDVQIGGANGSDAKTSCTRRYKAQQVLNSADGSVRDVESIFVPHGHIIFACHKATPRRPRGHPNSYPLYPTPAQFYDTPGHSHAPYYLPMPVPSQVDPYPGTTATAYPYHTHPLHSNQSSHPQPLQVHPHQSQLPSAGPSSPGGSRGAGAHSPYQPQQTQWQQHQQQQQQPSYLDHNTQNGQRYAQPFVDEVPPPRQRSGRLTPEVSGTPVTGASTRETYQGGGRAGGNPPVGVSRCAACKSTSSPEWRKGPSGRKDLCNACGLRYSRARAKKEGIVAQRRRKDGGKATGQVQAPSPSISNRRRAYPSNGYDFPLDEQQQHHLGAGSGDGSTPSPSPPHDYPHPHPNPQPHSQAHTSSGSSIYSYSSPLDPRESTVYMGQSHAYPTPPQQHANSFYAPTPSPAPADLSSASPSAGSTSVTSAASYERAGMPPESRSGLQSQHSHHHVHS